MPCRQFRAPSDDSSPRRRPVQAFGLYRLLDGVLSADLVIGGSRPGGRPLSCGDKERWIKRPCRSAGRQFLAPHGAGGSRRNSPSAGSDIDATIPAGRGLRPALQKGRPLRARLRIAGRLSRRRRSGLGSRARFVAPAQAGVQGFGLAVWFSGAFGWRRLAGSRPGGRPPSCGDKKDGKERPLAAAPASPVPSLRPRSGGSRRNSPWRAQTSTRQSLPAAGCTRRCKGKAAAGSASPLPAGVRRRQFARHYGHDRRSGAGRVRL